MSAPRPRGKAMYRASGQLSQFSLVFESHPGGFLGGSDGKEYACNVGDLGLILGSSPGVANGNPPQYSCLENSMDRGAWWAIVHGTAKSQT